MSARGRGGKGCKPGREGGVPSLLVPGAVGWSACQQAARPPASRALWMLVSNWAVACPARGAPHQPPLAAICCHIVVLMSASCPSPPHPLLAGSLVLAFLSHSPAGGRRQRLPPVCAHIRRCGKLRDPVCSAARSLCTPLSGCHLMPAAGLRLIWPVCLLVSPLRSPAAVNSFLLHTPCLAPISFLHASCSLLPLCPSDMQTQHNKTKWA